MQPPGDGCGVLDDLVRPGGFPVVLGHVHPLLALALGHCPQIGGQAARCGAQQVCRLVGVLGLGDVVDVVIALGNLGVVVGDVVVQSLGIVGVLVALGGQERRHRCSLGVLVVVLQPGLVVLHDPGSACPLLLVGLILGDRVGLGVVRLHLQVGGVAVAAQPAHVGHLTLERPAAPVAGAGPVGHGLPTAEATHGAALGDHGFVGAVVALHRGVDAALAHVVDVDPALAAQPLSLLAHVRPGCLAQGGINVDQLGVVRELLQRVVAVSPQVPAQFDEAHRVAPEPLHRGVGVASSFQIEIGVAIRQASGAVGAADMPPGLTRLQGAGFGVLQVRAVVDVPLVGGVALGPLVARTGGERSSQIGMGGVPLVVVLLGGLMVPAVGVAPVSGIGVVALNRLPVVLGPGQQLLVGVPEAIGGRSGIPAVIALGTAVVVLVEVALVLVNVLGSEAGTLVARSQRVLVAGVAGR